MASLNKGLQLLDLLGGEARGLPARDISAALGYPPSTTYRLLAALGEAGYVLHLKSQGRYVLGYRLHHLGAALHKQMGTPRSVARLVGDLSAAASAAAYYAVHRGEDIVIAQVADSPQYPRIPAMGFGFSGAIHATAFGKILLAGFSEPEQRLHLHRFGMQARTPRTITDEDTLIRQLRTVAREGLAVENAEYLPGTCCIAVAVCNGHGQTVGSVAVSVPAPVAPARMGYLGQLLRGTAFEIGTALRGIPVSAGSSGTG